MLFWSVLSRLSARLLDRRLRCRGSGLICVGLEALGVVTAGAGPYLLKVVVDRIGGRGSADWALGGVVATFVAAWTLPTFLSALRGVFSAKINSRLAAALGTGAVAGFLRAGAWRTAESGKVQSTIERVPYSLAVVLDGLVWRTVPMILQWAVGLAVIAKLTSPKYVVALAAMSVGFVLISWLGMRYQSAAAKPFNAATAACGALVGDILRNPRRIVSNGAAALEVAGVRSAFAAREAAEVRASLSLLGLSGAQWVVVGAGLTVILAAAAADVVWPTASSCVMTVSTLVDTTSPGGFDICNAETFSKGSKLIGQLYHRNRMFRKLAEAYVQVVPLDLQIVPNLARPLRWACRGASSHVTKVSMMNLPSTRDGIAFSRRPTVDRFVGDKLRGFRESTGLALQDLAAHLAISCEKIAEFEAGTVRIPAPTLFLLARRFGVPVAAFFGIDLERA